MSVGQLEQALKARAAVEVIDVRDESERQICSLAGSRRQDAARYDQLAPTTPLVFVCHTGRRSQAAAEQAVARGFDEVYNLAGGLDAWATNIDPSMPRY